MIEGVTFKTTTSNRWCSIHEWCFHANANHHQKIDLENIQNILKETENIGYKTNFYLYQLFGNKMYLESAYDKIQDRTKQMRDEFKQKFMDYPIPNKIIKEYGRVVS